jgi:hypothetical protein
MLLHINGKFPKLSCKVLFSVDSLIQFIGGERYEADIAVICVILYLKFKGKYLINIVDKL